MKQKMEERQGRQWMAACMYSPEMGETWRTSQKEPDSQSEGARTYSW